MKCVSCLQGLDWECRQKGECDELNFGLGSARNADGNGDFPGSAIGGFSNLVESDSGNTAEHRESDESDESSDDDDSRDPAESDFVTYKDDSALKDQQSTGRKRAAKIYPLDSEGTCEWKMRKNCGGGSFPIVGCMNGKQQARHHGPDKNTLNNEKGNVHRICHVCHNRWHTLNDPNYVWGEIYPLHDPMEASIADIGMNEVYWDGRKIVKARD